MKTQWLLLSAAFGLVACNGPWNMQSETGPQPAKLWVSMLLVGDKPLDTLWVERPISLGEAEDSTAEFIDAMSSQVQVIDPTMGDTLDFHPVAGKPAAWICDDTAYRVRRGAEYALNARFHWNAAPDFPRGSDWKTQALTASTRVPKSFAIRNEVHVPAEALHPSLSVGLPAILVTKALQDKEYQSRLYDSLDDLPGAPLASRGVSEDDFAAYLNGEVTYHPVPREGSLWYIFDATKATDFTGSTVHRYSLPYLFQQDLDKAEFGGLILSEHFDSSRARIYDPLQKGIDEALQQDLDSVEFYQPGNVRCMVVGGSYLPDLPMYPDTLHLTNLLWGYTGRNVMMAYSTDPLYFEYYKGLIQSGTDNDAGLGGGSSRAQNVLRYSNVVNGDGYFSSAVVDSFAFELKAMKDTIPVRALKSAWEKEHQL